MNGIKKPRRPRWARTDGLELAQAMARPVDDATRAEVNAMRHAALIRFAEGNTSTKDMTLFDFVVHIGREIAKANVGIEVLGLAARAEAVILAIRQRLADSGSTGTKPGEYGTLQELVALVDLQMQSMSRREYEACQRSAIGSLQRANLFNPQEVAA
jgi:hypothetical protein